MLEDYLIAHCAPTLANLKTASLFRCPLAELQRFGACRASLAGKGVEMTVLCRKDSHALVYVYRPSRLAADLTQPGAGQLLRPYGYNSPEILPALSQLRSRLAGGDGFPHEIGAFLGYPLGDVAGFIQNGGKNCCCVGCWKVYCNACEAKRTFARLHKCREVYGRLWRQGRSLPQLTVAA